MRKVRGITALLLALVLLLGLGAESALGEGLMQVQLKPQYRYDEARKMLPLINAFRTGGDAWYIGEDNQSKVRVSGLGKLEYDYTLENVAMLRALEIAVYFSHTRPDNSGWGTAFPGGYKAKGENLVYGYGSVDAAFKALAEEDKPYSGQGHRRNMLRKEFTRVGFGSVKVGNIIYWVQSFGAGGSGAGQAKKMKDSSVKVSPELLMKSSRSITTEVEVLSMEVGESVSLPKVAVYSNSGAKLLVSAEKWKTANKKIVKISGKKATGVKKGETTLEAVISGKKITLPVQVSGKVKPDKILETIDDYDPPLAGEILFVLEDDECFEIEE